MDKKLLCILIIATKNLYYIHVLNASQSHW